MSSRAFVHLVGSFSAGGGHGNPVYVVYEMGGWTQVAKQQFTSFANVSECVFVERVTPSSAGEDTIKVAIYNPNGKMDFAGHPLIGAARSLYEHFGIEAGLLDTGSVKIKFSSRVENGCRVAELEVPEPGSQTYERSADLCRLYDLPISELPIYDCGPRHVLLSVPNRRLLRNFDPKWEELKNFEDIALNVFCLDNSYVENRMFSPSYGVYEDRATGSVVIPILKELRKLKPQVKSVKVLQGTNRDSGVLMQGSYSEDSGKCHVWGNTSLLLEGSARL